MAAKDRERRRLGGDIQRPERRTPRPSDHRRGRCLVERAYREDRQGLTNVLPCQVAWTKRRPGGLIRRAFCHRADLLREVLTHRLVLVADDVGRFDGEADCGNDWGWNYACLVSFMRGGRARRGFAMTRVCQLKISKSRFRPSPRAFFACGLHNF